MIIKNGPEWFKTFGTEKSSGTIIFSVSGHFNKPGNYELPLGIPFNKLIEFSRWDPGWEKIKSGDPRRLINKSISRHIIEDCTMDYESLQEAGSALGTAAVVVIAEGTCMVNLLKRISRFYLLKIVDNAHRVEKERVGYIEF
ncbi:MAG: hypothetical protein Ct9H300mP6_16740 [Gammaproteobacteria bacterium]|nr:MAG: hypothetical protein Ct9H300mP6_16740 [Gammaproteobacteria bacterium]